MHADVLKIRIFFSLAILTVVSWLFFLAFSPGGRARYSFDCHNDEFVSKLTPKDRVYVDEKMCTQKIKGNPVYFNLQTLRKFNEASLKIVFSAPDTIKLIEAGVLVDGKLWRYDLSPVRNAILDNLGWERTTNGELVLFQKKKIYESVETFLADPPDYSRIATYDYDLDYEYLMPDYKKASGTSGLARPLRGDYQFYTYIKDEKLSFEFDFIDLNQNKDKDEIDINLYDQGGSIIAKKILEDGTDGDSGLLRTKSGVLLEEDGLKEGVYKVEVRANDDIVTSRLGSSQHKFSFTGKIWLHKSGSSDIRLYTDSHKIQAKTVNPDSLQTLRVNDKESLEIAETYRQFESKIGPGGSELNRILCPKDGLIISGDGLWSFDEASYFNPILGKVEADFQENRYDFVLARYDSPEVLENGLFEKVVRLDLSSAYREDNKYNFMISVPELKDGSAPELEIRSLEVQLAGRSLFDKIFH